MANILVAADGMKALKTRIVDRKTVLFEKIGTERAPVGVGLEKLFSIRQRIEMAEVGIVAADGNFDIAAAKMDDLRFLVKRSGR